ncbi:MAG: helix-turn-helix transcriptional regulator [Bacteroidetes bacterium]|nr:helix-turn-helix transcriptional regulator [Bacteroidota bacterium]
MSKTILLIAKNIKRLREVKKLSQKEICAGSGVPQGQYSRIENGKVEPSVSTLEKLAKVFEVSIAEFFKSSDVNDVLNLPLLEKIKMIDKLGKEEKQALFKMIDIAIANKRLKDNLSELLTS